jgi:hypothetical protein
MDFYASVVNHRERNKIKSLCLDASLNYFKAFAGDFTVSLLNEKHVMRYRTFLLETQNLRAPMLKNHQHFLLQKLHIT